MATAKSKVDGKRQKTGGRAKGTSNTTTALLKDAILKAAETAGDGDLVEYLAQQARTNPGPFLALLGKVLPLQVNADIEGGFNITIGRKDADCL